MQSMTKMRTIFYIKLKSKVSMFIPFFSMHITLQYEIMIETFRVENIFNIRRSATHCEKNFPDKIVFETTRKSCEILAFISYLIKKLLQQPIIHKLSLKIKKILFILYIYIYTQITG